MQGAAITYLDLPVKKGGIIPSWRLTNSSGRQIEELVAILFNLGEKLGNSTLGPILANDGENVPQYV